MTTMQFKQGDEVEWTSQAAGSAKTKRGVVVEVVPAGKRPQTDQFRLNAVRNYESYVVKANTKGTKKANGLFWPYPSKLALVGTAGTIVTGAASTQTPITQTVGGHVPPVVDVKKLVNRFALVLDRSGSMHSLRGDALRTFNTTLEAIRTQAIKTGQETYVSVYIFGSHKAVKLRDQEMAQTMAALRPEEYSIGGGTALFDAVGQASDDLWGLDRGDPNTSYCVMAVTDGEENESSRFCRGTGFMAYIQKLQATDRWTFAFMLPKGHYKVHFVRSYGVPEGNVTEWETTVEGVRAMAATNSASIGGYYASRSLGITSSKNFFEVDASKITDTDLKKMVDISPSVKIWTVPNEIGIADFVAAKTKRDYVLGSGYYQLMKKEKIQPQKRIMLRDKRTGAIYAGVEARRLLSLPAYEVTVVPGNFANFEIFIQSTSPNRKLPRGTQLIFLMPDAPVQPTWIDPKAGTQARP